MKTVVGLWKTTGALALVALLGAGCATGRGVRARTSDAFAKPEVPAVVRGKVEGVQPLTVTELATVLGAGVPEAAVMDYIRESRSVYHLETADVDRLRATQASDAFIDQVLATPTAAAPYRSSGYGGVYYAPYPRYHAYGHHGRYPGAYRGYGHGYYGRYGYGYRCY